jgi:hypothetical protein
MYHGDNGAALEVFPDDLLHDCLSWRAEVAGIFVENENVLDRRVYDKDL